MMYKYVQLSIALLLACILSMAQQPGEPLPDTVKITSLQEVLILSQRSLADKAAKPLSSLDNLLEQSATINMIKRGAYAWEPLINGMATERSVITIDGMRVYSACTDKMDPVTSYVEITNLASAEVQSGTGGSMGPTIAGSLNLVRKKGNFDQKQITGLAFVGYEFNNHQKITGAEISFSQPRFFADLDLSFRDADNYKAGKHNEVLYSSFTKYNVSAIAGYKLSEQEALEASVIYDHAVNVGYPALTMDVAFAKAIIAGLQYNKVHLSPFIHQWQTKLYYNSVAHLMDDSKRPHVPIHMDMPGRSNTMGFYSLIKAANSKHQFTANLSGHSNLSVADMTMYPQNAAEPVMYMLTWPRVASNQADLFVEDKWMPAKNWSVHVSGGLALQHNKLGSKEGFESLQVFYPQLSRHKTSGLLRAAAVTDFKINNFQINAGAGYGQRAASISEGYGVYLFNSFDGYDYIGNPLLKKEKALSANAGVSYVQPRINIRLKTDYFLIKDYIIALQQPGLSPMTIGAAGVKKYTQIDRAQLWNFSAELKYLFYKQWQWSSMLSYKLGKGSTIGRLPLIQPMMYQSAITAVFKKWNAECSVNGAAPYKHISTGFGEKKLPAYNLVNMAASVPVKLSGCKLHLKTGIENIFDRSYSSFADWNGIRRMGRNIFTSVILKW